VKNRRNELLTLITPTEGEVVPYDAVDRYGRKLVSVTHTVFPTPFTLRYEDTGTYTYVGEANAGSLEASAVWRVKRLTNSSNTIVWADGDTEFDNVWNDRAGLVYS